MLLFVSPVLELFVFSKFREIYSGLKLVMPYTTSLILQLGFALPVGAALLVMSLLVLGRWFPEIARRLNTRVASSTLIIIMGLASVAAGVALLFPFLDLLFYWH